MTTERTLGQVAFEAYWKARGIPSTWAQFVDTPGSKEFIDAWEAAAKAVVQKVFHDNPPETRGQS